jgi:hypothetical protein
MFGPLVDITRVPDFLYWSGFVVVVVLVFGIPFCWGFVLVGAI